MRTITRDTSTRAFKALYKNIHTIALLRIAKSPKAVVIVDERDGRVRLVSSINLCLDSETYTLKRWIIKDVMARIGDRLAVIDNCKTEYGQAVTLTKFLTMYGLTVRDYNSMVELVTEWSQK